VARELTGLHDSLVALGASDDPVEHLFALCREYVRYGREHPARYRVLVGRRFVDDWDRRGVTMERTGPLMAAVLAMVVEAIQACADAGGSESTDASFDALVLWFALHGLITVTQAVTSIPWPHGDVLFEACVRRAARLGPGEARC
jgi:AcrR family transcriptional regulator